jgi:hypothetical protein
LGDDEMLSLQLLSATTLHMVVEFGFLAALRL